MVTHNVQIHLIQTNSQAIYFTVTTCVSEKLMEIVSNFKMMTCTTGTLQ